MASSSSSRVEKFDVFLSFRGADTGKTFVSHLYRALDKKGFRTYKDEDRDGPLSPGVMKAIAESKAAIVVISVNYASSIWCLDVLSKISERRKERSMSVLPVFYGVDPWVVKDQRGKFAEDFQRHEQRESPEKVKLWRNSLTEFTYGPRCSSRQWEDDSKLLDDIIEQISSNARYQLVPRIELSRLISLTQEMSSTSSKIKGLPGSDRSRRDDAINPVGMDRHMKQLYGLLDLESDEDIRIIGIWGLGGVGKTTLARCVYEEISQHFQNHCFWNNVNKIHQDSSSLDLLENFMRSALTTRSFHESYDVIRRRLGHRKVLLVADGVDKIEQLKNIAKEARSFGPGSRVILTTEDMSSLVACGIKILYGVEIPRYDEALQLFSEFAFKQSYPPASFERLSVKAVELSGRLPLALKLFASFLRGKDIEGWKIALHKLEASRHNSALEVSSYISADEFSQKHPMRLEQYIGPDSGNYFPSFRLSL